MDIYYWFYGDVHASGFNEENVCILIQTLTAEDMFYFFADPAEMGF